MRKVGIVEIAGGVVGLLVIVTVILSLMATPHASPVVDQAQAVLPVAEPSVPAAAPATPVPIRGPGLADMQFDAKRRLEASMLDPDAAKYRNVEAVRATLDDGRSSWVFCGEVNGKNAMGGYTGFQRFIASPGVATTESGMDGFATAWAQFCSGEDRRTVWF